ncbi:hypothetical protein SAE02_32980 [Skermanella aerolata]|uniref:Uncharacterized protein n=1 Tax=Skermanella aerolata TaxID=393310 RepID=A0A512DSF9_9PROT|nr:hypothetical protein [Skermanella aerolata]KJB93250.1 hypothetical protein N826_16660 [Skermanella aerolata KACC 11604]GEO39150.1 hypothetical protein SAE02_32980 [Skermanella aerolata]
MDDVFGFLNSHLKDQGASSDIGSQADDLESLAHILRKVAAGVANGEGEPPLRGLLITLGRLGDADTRLRQTIAVIANLIEMEDATPGEGDELLFPLH